jgi:hypothetical protein
VNGEQPARPGPGTFVRVPLPDGTSGYGRVLGEPFVAFHRLRTDGPEADLDTIEAAPVLFAQAVRIADPQRWPALGRRDLTGAVLRPLVFFTQDVLDPRRCTIVDTEGRSRPAGPQECVGLERAAVWDQPSIERRLLDDLTGRPNEAELRARVRLS